MTIAVAIRCNDGLVLGSDQLMAHGTAAQLGSFAHYETKLYGADGRYFSATMVGAGDAINYRSLALQHFGA